MCEKKCITVKEAIAIYGIRKTSLHKLIRLGEIEKIKVCRRTLIWVQSMEDFMQRLRGLGPKKDK